MDRADNILAARVVDRGVRIFLAKVLVSNPLVCAKQADLVRDGFANEALKRRGTNVGDNSGDDVALALDRPDDDGLSSAARPAASVAALILMAVLREAANERLVNFNDTAKLFDVFGKSEADFVAHEPSGFIGTEAHDTLHLQGRYAFLAGQHHMNDAEPVAERLVRVLENRLGQMREAIAVGGALFALPMMAGGERIDLGVAAARAVDPFGPAPRDKVSPAMLFVREQRLELSDGELLDGLRPFLAGHDDSPHSIEGECHV